LTADRLCDGNLVVPVSNPMVICGSSSCSLPEPALAEPVALVDLEYSVLTS
jgi:hypothetical protein